jgi:hypothetical protein
MVGGTRFHCRILKAGLGRMSKKATARATATPPRGERQNPSLVYVYLDNADTVIEGGPAKLFKF